MHNLTANAHDVWTWIGLHPIATAIMVLLFIVALPRRRRSR